MRCFQISTIIIAKNAELKQLLLKYKGVFSMNLIDIIMERLRWRNKAHCPHCGSECAPEL